MLRAEQTGGEGANPQSLAAGGDGSISHEAVLGSDGVTTATVHTGDAGAGEQVSTVILNSRADARRTSPDEVVYLNQGTADGAGDLAVRMALPAPERGSGFWIAVGTSAEHERYVARLNVQ